MNKWRLLDGLCVLTVLAVVQATQPAVTAAVIPRWHSNLAWLVVTYYPTSVVALLALGLGWWRGVGFGFTRPQSWRPALYVWAAAVATGPIYALASGGVGGPAVISPWLALNVVPMAVVAPLAEETIFRGAVFSSLRSRMPVLPAIVLTGLLFAAFHLNASQLVPLTIVGSAFAYLYYRTGSLWASIAAHAGLNAIWLAGLIGMSLLR